jgi:hypothetical protein
MGKSGPVIWPQLLISFLGIFFCPNSSGGSLAGFAFVSVLQASRQNAGRCPGAGGHRVAA